MRTPTLTMRIARRLINEISVDIDAAYRASRLGCPVSGCEIALSTGARRPIAGLSDACQDCLFETPIHDFVLVIWCAGMPAYQALVQRLFTQDANVRQVRAYFSLQRAKFEPAISLPASPAE